MGVRGDLRATIGRPYATEWISLAVRKVLPNPSVNRLAVASVSHKARKSLRLVNANA